MFKRNRKTGFTLIELLVVISIIGILVFLLMPAIHQARESARRAQCINNVKNIAVAVNNYQAAHGRFPPPGLVAENKEATYLFGRFNPRSGKMVSWMALILPFIEENQLWEDFDFKKSVMQQPNNPQAKHVQPYLCPSGIANREFYQRGRTAKPILFAKGNYAAWVSPVHVDLSVQQFPGGLAGATWIQGELKGQKDAAILDGMSKTLMISEVRVREDSNDQRGAWALPWPGSSLIALDVHNDPRSFAAYTPWEKSLETAQTPNHIAENFDMLYECDEQAATEDRMPCVKWEPQEGVNHYLSAAPRSNHTGGVVAANMDASVTFLSDGIDPKSLAHRVSSNDGGSANGVVE